MFRSIISLLRTRRKSDTRREEVTNLLRSYTIARDQRARTVAAHGAVLSRAYSQDELTQVASRNVQAGENLRIAEMALLAKADDLLNMFEQAAT